MQHKCKRIRKSYAKIYKYKGCYKKSGWKTFGLPNQNSTDSRTYCTNMDSVTGQDFIRLLYFLYALLSHLRGRFSAISSYFKFSQYRRANFSTFPIDSSFLFFYGSNWSVVCISFYMSSQEEITGCYIVRSRGRGYWFSRPNPVIRSLPIQVGSCAIRKIWRSAILLKNVVRSQRRKARKRITN